MPSSTHESFERRQELNAGSDRSFGYVFAAVFTIIAVAQYWDGRPLATAAVWLAVAGAILLVAFVAPALLRPFNRLWFRFGLLLHRIVTPVVMGLIFFVAVTPVGLAMRVFDRRALSLKFEPGTESYWIHRTPPGPPPGSFGNQF